MPQATDPHLSHTHKQLTHISRHTHTQADTHTYALRLTFKVISGKPNIVLPNSEVVNKMINFHISGNYKH